MTARVVIASNAVGSFFKRSLVSDPATIVQLVRSKSSSVAFVCIVLPGIKEGLF